MEMNHVSQTVLLLVSTKHFVEIEELDLCVNQVTFTSLCTLYSIKEKCYIIIKSIHR